MAEGLERAVLERVASGEGQPPYSTRPGWYSARKHFRAQGRFARYARANGRSPRAAVLWMPQGYAQYKHLVTGRPFKTAPVDFELSGQLVRSLRGRARVSERDRTLTAWVGFRRQRRRGESITNEELALIHARRGSVNPFTPSFEQLDEIVAGVLGSLA